MRGVVDRTAPSNGNPAVAGGVSIRGPTLLGVGDVLLGMYYARGRTVLELPHEHPVVLPHVSHFMQVPLRTRVKLPHSPHISPS